MTTHHTPAPATTDATVAAADQALADDCQTSGDYLAGIIAKGMLDAVGTPKKLPELLFPDYDPEMVRAVAETYLAVGYRAGKLAGQPKWTPDALDRLRAALNDAGYNAMGSLAARSASIHPPRHPADAELGADAAMVREGGHQ